MVIHFLKMYVLFIASVGAKTKEKTPTHTQNDHKSQGKRKQENTERKIYDTL